MVPNSSIVIFILFAHLLNSGNSKGTILNDRPIIGILSQTEWNSELRKHGDAYIAASYVKYVESAGARVVPVLINQTDEYYSMIFNSVNGILMPGGGQNDLLNSGFGRAGKHLYDMAIKSFDAGDYFPIWGTCLGFELLTMLTTGRDLRAAVKAIDISFPLNLTKDYQTSHLMRDIPDNIVHTLTKVNMTFNYHHWGLTPTNFSKSDALKKFYRVLSTNVDINGVEFISTMEVLDLDSGEIPESRASEYEYLKKVLAYGHEYGLDYYNTDDVTFASFQSGGTDFRVLENQAYDYPIYGIMWHAEKNQFEWNPHKEFRVNHSLEAIQAVQFFANFFVNEARKNFHKFSSEAEESKFLIYNFTPVYTGDIVSYQQCYFFQTCSGIR